ncbi:uncharacterized protein [Malus domestica]|uniref:uncharacterized protein n=1 Tax=Malus domestica TaxID=3750 RepID=UPI003976058D
MVLSWIVNTLERDLSDNVLFTNVAIEIWADLEKRFEQRNTPRIFQIKRDIATLTQDQMSVSTYYSKLKGYWDELSSLNALEACSYGALKSILAREEQQHLMQFLMGLHESYVTIRGHILLMSPLPTTQKAYSLILQEERQRQIASNSTINNESMAMLSISNKKNGSGINGITKSRHNLRVPTAHSKAVKVVLINNQPATMYKPQSIKLITYSP